MSGKAFKLSANAPVFKPTREQLDDFELSCVEADLVHETNRRDAIQKALDRASNPEQIKWLRERLFEVDALVAVHQAKIERS